MSWVGLGYHNIHFLLS